MKIAGNDWIHDREVPGLLHWEDFTLRVTDNDLYNLYRGSKLLAEEEELKVAAQIANDTIEEENYPEEVWLTTKAFSSGIVCLLKKDGWEFKEGWSKGSLRASFISRKGFAFEKDHHAEKGQWFETKEKALEAVEKKKQKDIESARKKIEKLEAFDPIIEVYRPRRK